MRRTTAAAGVLVAAALSFGFTGTAQAADKDCADFPSQAAAQANLVANPSDPNRLDRDKDGQACEDFAYSSPSSSNSSTSGSSSQVSTVPSGAVAAGDGSAADEASILPYVLGGVAFAGAAGAAVASRRKSHASV